MFIKAYDYFGRLSQKTEHVNKMTKLDKTMRKNIVIIFCLILFSAWDIFAQPKDEQNRIATNLSSDSLVNDFLFFCDMLEETHPDPYTGFGGRQFFPTHSPYAQILKPDIEITSQDYHNHNLDANTPILRVLEICRNTD